MADLVQRRHYEAALPGLRNVARSDKEQEDAVVTR